MTETVNLKDTSALEEQNVCSVYEIGSSRVNSARLRQSVILAQKESKFVRNLIEKGDVRYTVRDGVLYYTKRGGGLVVPKHYARELVEKLHLPNHLSAKIILRYVALLNLHIADKYAIIAQCVQSCDVCGSSKSKPTIQTTNLSTTEANSPFSICAIDIMMYGMDKHVLVLVDVFSRYILARLLPDPSGESVRHQLLSWFSVFGTPEQIVSDNGTNIINAESLRMFEALGIVLRTIAPGNSRGNSIAERAIQKIQVKSRLLQPRLDELRFFLEAQIYSLNFTLNDKDKFTPAQLFFCRTSPLLANLPVLSQSKRDSLSSGVRRLFDEAIEIRNHVMEKARIRRKQLAGTKNVYNLRKGDLVRIKLLQLRNQPKKLFRPFTMSKYRILKINHHNQTALLQEVCSDKVKQPARVLRAFRFLQKIRCADDEALRQEDDDYVAADPTGTTTGKDGQTSVQDVEQTKGKSAPVELGRSNIGSNRRK